MALEDLRNTTTSVPPPPGQTLELHLAAHHCYACHTRGDREGIHASREPFFVGDDSLGNDGRWPPPLTGAGGKLNPTWIREVIEGKVRPRTYLRTRMPHYAPALAEVFTDLIQRADQPLQAQAPTATWLESGDLEAGRLLVGVEGGMGCITCHGWKDHPGLTMNALNLSTAPQRLQPGWFQQYLLSPQTFRPGTIMPSFWPDGQSAHPGVLGGDTSRQIASIWRFLKEGVAEPGGYPEQVAGAYELQPTLQAIVQRGFIEPAGTHAIAVGFTNHLNLLFDADSCRPVAVWRGRFINAYQLWFSRLKPTAEPLAPPHLLNANPILQVLSPSPAPLRFQGYRLEGADRHPVFLYRIGLVTVMDRITPTHEAKGVRRHLTLSTSQEGVILQFAPHISSVTAEDHDRIKSPIKLSPGQPLTLTIHHP